MTTLTEADVEQAALGWLVARGLGHGQRSAGNAPCRDGLI